MPTIATLIAGWYGWSSAIPGYTAAQLKVAYQIGPRVYCRSCHAAMVAGFNVQNFYAFANSGVKAPVFGKGLHRHAGRRASLTSSGPASRSATPGARR